ncbi:hypothetical protein Nepgr_028010 [Nepenthes gracilis]|uniref:Pentatricopeptide repeat-containing protein n=1 Tax=Nepenthes gracilis TaxID=150966 RepID=A0AAD3TB57_NEPGR|nr:hypothetical protein Nepgr_028010 [Nepenthes gracilis]
MVRLLPSARLPASHINRVFYCLFSPDSFCSLRLHCSIISTRLNWPASPSNFAQKPLNIHAKSTAIHFPNVERPVPREFGHLPDGKVDTFSTAGASLNELLLRISRACPETSRKFLRVHVLKPEDVLEILLSFQLGIGNLTIELRHVESLWAIFRWASDGNKGCEHLPRSYEVMASMLVRVGMLSEVELLLSEMESRRILLVSGGIFSNLIEAYVGTGELDRAILMYDRMKGKRLAPSLTCYHSLLEILIEMNETQLAFGIFDDMVEVGVEFGDVEGKNLEKVIRLLCRDGKIQQARKLVKKMVANGLEPSALVLNEIANVYCEKRDFEDLLSFFVDMKSAPDVFVGNRVVYYLCCSSGIDRAHLFLEEMKHVGFCPDEITFGILIGWCCFYGKLSNAFVYLSEIISRNKKPDLHSYNALISGLFKEGMWQHARDVLNEMIDNGVKPTLETFKILLAGYCKVRRFDKMKAIVGEMIDCDLIHLSPHEDLLSKAFVLLGLDPLNIKVKRDNDVRYSKAEFYDDLGNGLYLDTNLNEIDQMLIGVLEESMIPDFNQLLTTECKFKNLKAALLMVDEMVLRGQKLSHASIAALVSTLCASHHHIKSIPSLLRKMPNLVSQLDEESLKLLVNSLGKKGFADVQMLILNEMHQGHLRFEKETYTALMVAMFKTGNLRNTLYCWNLAKKANWLPELKDCDALLGYLCQSKMMKDVLELFDNMLTSYPNLRAEICDVFLEKLCASGFTESAYTQVKDLLQDCQLDHIAYRHLIRGYYREKKFSKALMLLDCVPADKWALCLDALILLVPELYRAKRIKDAVTITEMGITGHSSISVSLNRSLIKGYCMVGKVVEASTLFLKMFSKELIPNDEIYNLLLQGHCLANHLRKVEELLGIMNSLFVGEILDDLQELGLPPDEVTFNFLVYGFSKCKDMSKSVNSLCSMISKDLRPSNRNLRAVICFFCGNGEVQKALELSKEMESRGWIHDSIIQGAIVEALLSGDRVHEAESFLTRMAQKSLIPNNVDYNNVIQNLCWHGRLDSAIYLLDIMLQKGNIPNSASYDSVIYSSCACNELEQAMDFFTEMIERNLNPGIRTWDVLVHNFCRHGKISEAERLLICMVEKGLTPTRKMYCTILDEYCSAKNLSKASEFMRMMQKDGYEPDFETHWFLISNLNNSSDRDDVSSCSQGFLSKLLTGSGFFL